MDNPPSQDNTAQRITAVALRLFTERGYEKTSMQAIADELDVTKAALYYHFRSKEAIFDALAAPFLDETEQLLALAEKESLHPARAAEMIDDLLTLVLNHRRLIQLVTTDQVSLAAMGAGKRLAGIDRRFRRLLATGRDAEGAIRAAAATGAIMAAVSALPNLPSGQLRGPLRRAALAILSS